MTTSIFHSEEAAWAAARKRGGALRAVEVRPSGHGHHDACGSGDWHDPADRCGCLAVPHPGDHWEVESWDGRRRLHDDGRLR